MSHNSPRSLRIKQEARTRADMAWHGVHGQKQEAKLSGVTSNWQLSGGSELAQLIATSDAHQQAMRKIVQ